MDTDWPDDRRQEVIDYIIKKYGNESCCQIITFGTMKAKKAIGDVGRAIGIPQREYLQISKMIPNDLKITIPKALATSTELKAKYDSSPEVKHLLDIAMQVEGLPSHISTHAAGMLVADRAGLVAHVPLAMTDKGVVAQFAMGNLEDLGMLKLDLLGLNTLKIIVNTLKSVKKHYGIDINPYDLYACDDLKVLEVIRNGWTEGIFQLESGGMTAFMKELAPSNIEEIIAGVALYRPGPMDMIPQYIEGKRDTKTIHYDFPELEPIFKETYGVMVYQEQCMKSAIAVAGYQKHHSDSLRKAIAKKKEDLMKQHRTWFIDGRPTDEEAHVDLIPGGVATGHIREELERFFDKMEKFGSYSFNKSHAACYAVLAYVTAWLKYYYPTEFMAVNMDEKRKDQALLSRYIKHCEYDLNIEIIAPSINESETTFTATADRKIIFSLAVRDTNSENLGRLVDERNLNGVYQSMEDFVNRASEIIDRSSFKSLTYAGAFDCLEYRRSNIIAGIDDMMDAIQKCKNAVKRYESNPRSRRKSAPELSEWVPELRAIFPDILEFSDDILLRMEKYYLGVYISGHPLNKFRCSIESFSNFQLSDMTYDMDEETGSIIPGVNVADGQKIQIIAQISEIKKLVTKKDNLPMAVVILEDLTGSTKALFFPSVYEKYFDILAVDVIYRINGYIRVPDDEPPFISISSIAVLENDLHKRLIYHANGDMHATGKFVNYLLSLRCQGESPVYVRYLNTQTILKRRYWVNIDLFEAKCDDEIKSRCIVKEW